MKGWKELIYKQHLHLNIEKEHLKPEKKVFKRAGITTLQEKTLMLITETLSNLILQIINSTNII